MSLTHRPPGPVRPGCHPIQGATRLIDATGDLGHKTPYHTPWRDGGPPRAKARSGLALAKSRPSGIKSSFGRDWINT